MAAFRRGHHRTKGSGMRLGVLVLAAGIALLALFMMKRYTELFSASRQGVPATSFEHRDYLPANSRGQVIHHTYYTLSYSEQHEQSEWVAYALTRENLDLRRVERTDWFYPDYAVRTRSAFYRDYTGSGYTRGHLVPAADMAFDTLAMKETFFMSNISPQVRAFNVGIWRELEEQVRDWARQWGRLLILTGPVLTEEPLDRIGQNRVAVPPAFYKVIADPDEPEIKVIAFIIPNARSDLPLMSYAVTVDSVENLTGLDFFHTDDLPLDESAIDTTLWEVDKQRYRKRVTEWNFQ